MTTEFSIKLNGKSDKDFNKLEMMGLELSIADFFKKNGITSSNLSLRLKQKKKDKKVVKVTP